MGGKGETGRGIGRIGSLNSGSLRKRKKREKGNKGWLMKATITILFRKLKV